MAKVYIENVRDLVEKAGEIREKLALATRRIGNVHIGGPMSATDVTTAIYYKYMGFDPENLDDPNRDRFILSKGHNGILLFTIFCDMGMYDWDLLLDTYNTIGHPFGAHPNHKRVKGIEVSTGSLGHSLGIRVHFRFRRFSFFSSPGPAVLFFLKKRKKRMGAQKPRAGNARPYDAY